MSEHRRLNNNSGKPLSSAATIAGYDGLTTMDIALNTSIQASSDPATQKQLQQLQTVLNKHKQKQKYDANLKLQSKQSGNKFNPISLETDDTTNTLSVDIGKRFMRDIRNDKSTKQKILEIRKQKQGLQRDNNELYQNSDRDLKNKNMPRLEPNKNCNINDGMQNDDNYRHPQHGVGNNYRGYPPAPSGNYGKQYKQHEDSMYSRSPAHMAQFSHHHPHSHPPQHPHQHQHQYHHDPHSRPHLMQRNSQQYQQYPQVSPQYQYQHNPNRHQRGGGSHW